MSEAEDSHVFNIDKSNFSGWFSEILKTADLVDLRYDVKGFVVYKPWLMRMAKELYSSWEKELESRGHDPTLFPVVIPEENFEREKDHVEGFSPEVFWVTRAGDSDLEERLALRPTSEAAFYTLYSLWIRSHSDLPLKLYQSCAVYRYDTKATKPLIRGREFLWIEAHDVFETEEQALAQVESDIETTRAILEGLLGIPMLFFRRPAFDKFPGAVDTYAADALMPDGRAVQLPSTHNLGQGFAKSYGIIFEDAKGEKKIPHQTCYGPPISRSLAALISIHGDRKGLVLPFPIAPTQVVIVPIIYRGHREAVLEKCHELAEALKQAGLRATVDQSDRNPGMKFYYWEMKGVPVRAEIGPRDLESGAATLVRRDTGEKTQVDFEKCLEAVREMGVDIVDKLRERASEELHEHIAEAEDMESLSDHLASRGGFVRIPFCSRDFDGEECAERIKELTDGEVRGTIFGDDQVPENLECVVCGEPATCFVMVARSY